MKPQKVIIPLVSIGVMILLGWLAYQLRPYTFNGIVLQSPSKAPDFTLTAHTGETLSLGDFEGELVVIFFGYTHCPDICPTTLTTLTRAMEELGKRSEDIQVLFISVDPERDTPEELAEYMAHFNPDFIGLTGSEEEIARVATLYNVYFEKEEGSDATGYLVNHTASVMVIDRDGYLKLYQSHDVSPEELASDLAYMLR